MTKKDDGKYAVSNMEVKLNGYAKITEPTQITGEKQFDSLGRPKWINTPDAGKKQYIYNNLGLLESVISYGKNQKDEAVRKTRYQYDNLNRLEKVIYSFTGDPDQEWIEYSYYPAINSYNSYRVENIKKGILHQDGSNSQYYSVSYRYGPLCFEEEKNIEGTSYTTKYDYDIQGRINKLTYPDKTSVEYSYNRGGLLKSIMEPSGLTSEIHPLDLINKAMEDLALPLWEKQASLTKSEGLQPGSSILTTNLKDLLFKSEAVGYERENTSSSSLYKYQLNLNSNLIVENNLINNLRSKYFIREIQYNRCQQRSSVKYGNGVKTTYEYQPDTYFLESMKVSDSKDSIILDYNYDFDHSGSLRQITDRAGGHIKSIQKYDYDIMGRIKSGKGNFYNGQLTPFKYSLNIVDNQLQDPPGLPPYVQDGGVSYNEAYTFDDSYRMKTKNTQDSSFHNFHYLTGTHAIDTITVSPTSEGMNEIKYSYDDFGSMTNRLIRSHTGTQADSTDFVYSPEGKLRHIDHNNYTLDFKYDHKGQRISKVALDKEDNSIKRTVYVNGFYDLSQDMNVNKHLSDGINIFASSLSDYGGELIFYTTNNIGSTVMLTNKRGIEIKKYAYTPYGDRLEIDNSKSTDVAHLYTGQEYDSESGLYYYNNRYYNTDMGTFLSPDPVMNGLNHYSYTKANPIRYSDPTGLSEEEIANEDEGYIEPDYDISYETDAGNEYVFGLAYVFGDADIGNSNNYSDEYIEAESKENADSPYEGTTYATAPSEGDLDSDGELDDGDWCGLSGAGGGRHADAVDCGPPPLESNSGFDITTGLSLDGSIGFKKGVPAPVSSNINTSYKIYARSADSSGSYADISGSSYEVVNSVAGGQNAPLASNLALNAYISFKPIDPHSRTVKTAKDLPPLSCSVSIGRLGISYDESGISGLSYKIVGWGDSTGIVNCGRPLYQVSAANDCQFYEPFGIEWWSCVGDAYTLGSEGP